MRSDEVVAALGPDLRSGAVQTGADDDGVVLVRVAADGAVVAVEISPRWGERLRGADALAAAAVLGAYRQALLKRMAARLINGPVAVSPPVAERPDVEDEGWLEGVRESLERTYRQLAAISRALPRDEVVSGPGADRPGAGGRWGRRGGGDRRAPGGCGGRRRGCAGGARPRPEDLRATMIRYTIEALHAEAGKWRRLSSKMDTVVGGLDRLVLQPEAFFFPDLVSPAAHFRAYTDFLDWQRKLLTAAVLEFQELGEALDRAADLVEVTDGRSALDLHAVYGVQEGE